MRVINLLFNETSGCVSESNNRILYHFWIQLKRELIRLILEQEQNQLSVKSPEDLENNTHECLHV